MPNWITIRVKADNPKVFKEKFLVAYTEEEIKEEKHINDWGEELPSRVDFHLLIPTPADLQIRSGGGSYKNENNYYGFEKEGVQAQKSLITPLLKQTYKEELTQEEYINVTLPLAMGTYRNRFMEVYGISNSLQGDRIEEEIRVVLQGFYNFEKYGAVDWYDYQIKKWGTKWNADTIYVDEERGFAEFRTAWSCPFEILEELAKYTDIAVSYADEDIGNNFGVYTIKNGITEKIVESDKWDSLNGRQKISAIATSIALTEGEVYELNEQLFNDEDEQAYGVDKQTALQIGQKTVEEISKVLSELNLYS